jgi:folate-dependent phosphoribosylglycinamide formyltransferase PurN
MREVRGTTCQVTSFFIEDAPTDSAFGQHPWMAIATAHVYDANVDTGGALTPEMAILAGEVMRTIHAKASSKTEAGAMTSAVRALLDALVGMGFSKV